MQITPARVASLLAGVATLFAGLAPAVANLDTTSTVGLLAGAAGIIAVLDRFLVGQREHEARQAYSDEVDEAYANAPKTLPQIDAH